jgi:hypothetical protein
MTLRIAAPLTHLDGGRQDGWAHSGIGSTAAGHSTGVSTAPKNSRRTAADGLFRAVRRLLFVSRTNGEV